MMYATSPAGMFQAVLNELVRDGSISINQVVPAEVHSLLLVVCILNDFTLSFLDRLVDVVVLRHVLHHPVRLQLVVDLLQAGRQGDHPEHAWVLHAAPLVRQHH